MKHGFALFLLAIGLLTFPGPARAATYDLGCSSTEYGPGAGFLDAVHLARTTNSHAETPSQSNYSTIVRCVLLNIFAPLNTTTNLVDLFYLDATTNAHASVTPDFTYNVPLRAGVLDGSLSVRIADRSSGGDCFAQYGEIPGGSAYVTVARLSDTTNAHVQDPDYSGGTAYNYEVCLAWAPPGTPTDAGDIISTSQNGLPTSFLTTDTATLDVQTINYKNGDPLYAGVSTFRVTAACDLANSACAGIGSYGALRTEVFKYINGDPTTILVSGSVKGTNHGSNYPTTIPGLNTIPFDVKGNLDGMASDTDTYTIGTGSVVLPAGNYRIMSIDLGAKYSFNGSATTESAGYTPSNFATNDITITPPASEPGDGGDVYVLKSIAFPNLYRTMPINVEIELINKQYAPNSETNETALHVVIRKANGEYVPGFSHNPTTQTYDVSIPVAFTSGALTHTVQIQPPSPPVDTFNVGETYTLYATIGPYEDANPLNSESITGNNSAFRTFTTLDPPQNLSIPDNSTWLSIFMVAIVLGWLFVSARKTPAKKIRE